MKTVSIIGTDWTGPQPEWLEQPFLDGGRLHFNRMYRPDWDNLIYELANVGRVDSVAVGMRGAYPDGVVPCLPILREAYEQFQFDTVGGKGKQLFTLMPFYDTGSLPDMVNEPNSGTYKFDFANDAHIDTGWKLFVKPFFDGLVRDANSNALNPIRLETSPNKKVLCLWWAIGPHIGWGFTNCHLAQRLLDRVDQELVRLGLHGADHIVDHGWLQHAPNLHVFGLHGWFNPYIYPGHAQREAYSIKTHHGVTVGLTVPSFYNPDNRSQYHIDPQNGETLRRSLAAMRRGSAAYVFMESATNFHEGARLLRRADGDETMLDAIAEHVQLVTPIEPPTPEPDSGGPMIAVSETPLVKMVSLPVVSGNAPGTYAIRWNAKTNKPDAKAVDTEGIHGEPPTGQPTYFSIQKDGSVQVRIAIGKWESGTVEGDKLWFTADDEAYAVFAFRAPTS